MAIALSEVDSTIQVGRLNFQLCVFLLASSTILLGLKRITCTDEHYELDSTGSSPTLCLVRMTSAHAHFHPSPLLCKSYSAIMFLIKSIVSCLLDGEYRI